MKYKVNDRVRIKSIDWYNENKDAYGYVGCIDSLFTPEHSKYCGCEFTISHITEFRIPSYVMESNGHEWTDEMIECKVEESVLSASNITESIFISEKDMKWTTEYILPDGYQFVDENGNVINAQKIVLEKRKKEYPKTYKECCDVLGLNTMDNDAQGYKWELIIRFQELLIARDAYWKIAGEEMGLGKLWEPDSNTEVYNIYHFIDKIDISCSYSVGNCNILEFPTKEMRDAFYENFKELIESTKELL